MNNEKNVTRLTIDLTQDLHKDLKVRCAKIDKTMRDFVIEAIKEKAQDLEMKDNPTSSK